MTPLTIGFVVEGVEDLADGLHVRLGRDVGDLVEIVVGPSAADLFVEGGRVAVTFARWPVLAAA